MHVLNFFCCVHKHTLATWELLVVFGRSSVLFWYVSEILPAECLKH